MEKPSYKSESLMEKCRVCKTVLLRKNYKTHLKKIHPKEDPGDLSGWSQQKIFSIFAAGGGSRDRKEVVEDKVEELQDVDDTVLPTQAGRFNDNKDVTEAEAGTGEIYVSRKKRFDSGDSAFIDDDSTIEDFGPGSKDLDNDHVTKLDLILEQIKSLRSEVNDLKSVGKNNKSEDIVEPTVTDDIKQTLMSLQCSRSMEEIEGIGFSFNEEDQKVKCVLCDTDKSAVDGDKLHGIFSYDASDGLSFKDKDIMPRSFINLKAIVKTHVLKSKLHCSNLMKENEKKEAESELANKNKKAGLNLGQAAIKNYKHGRPYTDYENDVFLMKKSGGVVGELNHSRKFPSAFRKSVCRVVNGRVRKFLKTPLKQTGQLPPVAISADKGTYKGTPRQFCGITTINPGGDEFLEVLTAGQPVVSEGSSGSQLGKNMTTLD